MLTDPNLKSKVDVLWDRFWSGGIAKPLTAIESVSTAVETRLRTYFMEKLRTQQMSYLIFLKRLEDMDNARAAAVMQI
ncbi:MAG: hypothetical protein KKF20_03775, partial [Bacteroidetes bacterium]|nr:hypothetical protein [Bacteroidota bacterium]